MTDGWALLGRAADLAEPGQWITGWMGTVPVVVRNFAGTPRGFRNICSHRFAQMLTAPTGKGPLRCPYHAWVYDADGVPKAIPFNDTDFHLDDADRQAMALPAVAVLVTGKLVFTHLQPDADPAPVQGWPLTDGPFPLHLPDGSLIGADAAILERPSSQRGCGC